MKDVTITQTVSANKSIGRRSNGKYLLFDHSISVARSYTRDYDYMGIREDGRIDIQLNDSWGMMDIQGRVLVYPRFSKPLVFDDGLCIVQDSQYDIGHFGVVEYNGIELVPTIYENIMLEKEEIFNSRLGCFENRVNFIFGCVDDNVFIPSIGHASGYISHLREDYGVDMYLRNGDVLSGKHECFYVTFDRQYVFAGYKGYKIRGYDGDHKEYLKRYEGYHELIDKEGVVLLNRICDFIYYPTIKAIKLGFENAKWSFLNSDNNFVTRKGDIITIEAYNSQKPQDIYWPMTSDDDINSNFKLLSQICDCKGIEFMINEMKKKTILMTEEDYEDESYPKDDHDPYQYSRKY